MKLLLIGRYGPDYIFLLNFGDMGASCCPPRPMWARSSGGERYVDIVEVAGSKPAAPTIFFSCVFLPKKPPKYLDGKENDAPQTPSFLT